MIDRPLAGVRTDGPDAARTPPAPAPITRAEDIRLGPLESLIGFHLRLAQDASFRAFAGKTGERDLRPGRFAVMMLIHLNPGITPMALSRASGRDKSSLTPVLRDLETRGLVGRRPVPNDRRSHTLALTPEGEAMLERLRAQAEAHDRRLDEIVGADRKPELLRLLRQIITELE